MFCPGDSLVITQFCPGDSLDKTQFCPGDSLNITQFSCGDSLDITRFCPGDSVDITRFYTALKSDLGCDDCRTDNNIQNQKLKKFDLQNWVILPMYCIYIILYSVHCTVQCAYPISKKRRTSICSFPCILARIIVLFKRQSFLTMVIKTSKRGRCFSNCLAQRFFTGKYFQEKQLYLLPGFASGVLGQARKDVWRVKKNFLQGTVMH